MQKIFRGLCPRAAVGSDGMESDGIKFQFAGFSHSVHTSLQLFFRLKQVPFDGAERDAQFPGNICLSAIFKIIRNHDSPLQPGKIRNLPLKAANGVRAVVWPNLSPRVCQYLRHFIKGDSRHALRRIPVVIAERIVCHCPDKPARIPDIVPRQKRPERLHHNLLGQIFRIVNVFAPLQCKPENLFQIFRYNPLCILSVHLSLPHCQILLKAFTYIDTRDEKGWEKFTLS